MRSVGGMVLAALLSVACGDDGRETTGVTEVTQATTTTAGAGIAADDIPVAHTPEGGWAGAMPAPVLADCTEPLVDRAPDLAGLVWDYVRFTARLDRIGGPTDPYPAT